MAVALCNQRHGVSNECIDEMRLIAKKWPSGAIRLDAYDVEAGAGDFYRKCGFTKLSRNSYRGVPLIYFEMQLYADINRPETEKADRRRPFLS